MALGARRLPFVRGAYADGGGTILDRSVSTGVGYQLSDRRDYVGFGVNWGRASEELTGGDAEEQITLEAYYRLEPFKPLQITPDVQYVIDPALDPTKDSLWVVGLRVRALW